MAHAIVAVDQRSRRLLLRETDARALVDAAGLEAPHVDRQPDHAVGVAAAQIGFHHQPGDLLRISGGKPRGFERPPHERGKHGCSYAR